MYKGWKPAPACLSKNSTIIRWAGKIFYSYPTQIIGFGSCWGGRKKVLHLRIFHSFRAGDFWGGLYFCFLLRRRTWGESESLLYLQKPFMASGRGIQQLFKSSHSQFYFLQIWSYKWMVTLHGAVIILADLRGNESPLCSCYFTFLAKNTCIRGGSKHRPVCQRPVKLYVGLVRFSIPIQHRLFNSFRAGDFFMGLYFCFLLRRWTLRWIRKPPLPSKAIYGFR